MAVGHETSNTRIKRVAVGHETLNTRIKSVAVGGCGWLWFLNGDLGG